MFLIVGLGNPGKVYEHTPHNAGFAVLDEFAQTHGFPEFTLHKKSNSLLAEGVIEGQKVLLAKPQTFMNNSGSSVSLLTKNYKLKTINLVVVHDDIDLPLGKTKLSVNRGSAGHKGVQSIIEALGTKNFTRIRIGIQPIAGKPENVEAFVIKKLSKDQQAILQPVIESACSAIESLTIKKGGQ